MKIIRFVDIRMKENKYWYGNPRGQQGVTVITQHNRGSFFRYSFSQLSLQATPKPRRTLHNFTFYIKCNIRKLISCKEICKIHLLLNVPQYNYHHYRHHHSWLQSFLRKLYPTKLLKRLHKHCFTYLDSYSEIAVETGKNKKALSCFFSV